MNIPEYLGYSIDNEYAFVYLEYGFVGIVALASLILLLIFLSVSNRYRIGNLGLIMVMLICGLTNLSFTNLEIAPIFFILFAGTSTFFAYSKNPENEIQQQAT